MRYRSTVVHKYSYLLQVYVRIDQPQTALEQYSQAAARQEGQTELLLGQARVHDALNDLEQGVKLYKQVRLQRGSPESSRSSCVSSLMCSHSYYCPKQQ